ncbi:MAG: GGDEF domain-containing protein [Clostridiales bacterium]|uniref:Diguanylate cyclase (GGDEF)-like protein n=1 Tax=Harryflintia acetispora TaxID=1849041 RepID=A0A9X8Y948_9FIRM|nr:MULTISPECIES: GGDEF domain-containing protein [Oscillospiraceae]PWM38743.1 MAG: GGDEF domain-containing protein [Clostridiales bacterium]RGB69003.1 GGDEF domain-containing protein [Harryflintia acetispora]TCL45141.1 diguanylate cyclase (GGDEF)-like protein [Harryflintia acetispora]
MKRLRLRRVDLQVTFFTAAIVLVSSMLISFFYYRFAYDDMIGTLNERVESIYGYLDQTLDKSTFTEINTREDQQKPSYQQTKQLLADLRATTGVRYLYTAKQNEAGEFIYVVDGLPSDAEDFRFAGDPIEPEIKGDMQRALDGEVVLPDNIKKTDWGKIFITYVPIHDGERVVGVLGIEFEAEHQYNTYRNLRLATPLIVLFACLVSAGLALVFFRRVSNPTFQDMANTDQLTQLKNRNAYDVDIENMIARGEGSGYGVVVMDLNGLKSVNDTLGHHAGDLYIQAAAGALRRAAQGGEVLYRIGGDEFVVLIKDATRERLDFFMERVRQEFERSRKDCVSELSAAMGCALHDETQGETIYATYCRADSEMYRDKRVFHRASGMPL